MLIRIDFEHMSKGMTHFSRLNHPMECSFMLECPIYQTKFDHILHVVRPVSDELTCILTILYYASFTQFE